MTRAFVLMTAMPPTKGHLNLIRFASSLAPTTVIVCTQPSEPFVNERYLSIIDAVGKIQERFIPSFSVQVNHLHRELEQNPAAEGFWEMWDDIMKHYGFRPGDYCVSSEPYGATLAERLGGIFMPYDPSRELFYTKATKVRERPLSYFDWVLPEFQKFLRTKVTIFGAESTGKTTLSKELAKYLRGDWLYEWARPYLETVGPEINIDSMTAIWKGQLAAQRHAEYWHDKPYLIQDTDLFSTIGYWEQPHWTQALGPVPNQLIVDALNTQSDLYLITKSNIPFEVDPIRYGGDKRESPDEFWVGIAEKYDLPYEVIEEDDLTHRVGRASLLAHEAFKAKTAGLNYDRMGL